jgi:hypothetical protein
MWRHHFRIWAFLLAALGATFSAAQEQGKNFILSIDGKDVGIDIGETLEVEGADGRKVKVSLRRAEQVTFRGDLLSFAHRGDLAVSSTEVDKGIRQHLLASANGTIIIMQEYTALDPTSLLELMLTSVTEESVAAGGKLTRSDATRQVGGRDVRGLKAEVVNGSEKTLVETYTLGQSGKGLVIITQIADDALDTDRAVLDLFWQSLSLNL